MSEDPKDTSQGESTSAERKEVVPYNPENRRWCFGEKTVLAGGQERIVHETANFGSNFAMYQHIAHGGRVSNRTQPYMQAMVDEMRDRYHYDEIFQKLAGRYPGLYHDFLEDARDLESIKDYKGPLWDSSEPRLRPRSLDERDWTSSQVFDVVCEIAPEIDPKIAVWSDAESDLRVFCS